MLKGKTVVLGVTGGIAAYKSAALTSLLVKAGAQVQVIMTEHARQFIAPLTFESLTGRRCLTDTFDRNHEYSTEHVELAKECRCSDDRAGYGEYYCEDCTWYG